MRTIFLSAVVSILSVGCAPIGLSHWDSYKFSLDKFPSQYATDADFINLVSDDKVMKAQGVKNVVTYYDCLIKATSKSYLRQDPIVIFGSESIAFSEIPHKIYENRLEKLGKLITDQNKGTMQSIVEREIRALDNIRWNEATKEVRSIVGGANISKYACPVGEKDLEQLRERRNQRLLFAGRPAFIPPFM